MVSAPWIEYTKKLSRLYGIESESKSKNGCTIVYCNQARIKLKSALHTKPVFIAQKKTQHTDSCLTSFALITKSELFRANSKLCSVRANPKKINYNYYSFWWDSKKYYNRFQYFPVDYVLLSIRIYCFDMTLLAWSMLNLIYISHTKLSKWLKKHNYVLGFNKQLF